MASPQSNLTAPYPPPADPFTQPVTLLLPDGTPFNVTMDQFSWFHSYTTQLAVSRGTAFGATFVMLLAVSFLTQHSKRRSPVFLLNLSALSLNCFRTLFMAVWVAGPYTDPYAVIAGDWAHITSADVGASIAVPVFTLLALATVLASLMLQVRVAMSTARRRVRRGVLAACGLAALGSLGTEMAVMVVNIKNNILDFQQTANDVGWALLVEANNLVILLNMCLFTLIFVSKLGFAIWRQVRRLSSAQKFGPLQVLFIMGVQTLIVPTIMLGLQYATTVPEMSTWCLTIVCLSLPLSSLWAAATIGNQTRAGSHSFGGPKLPPPTFDSSADKSRFKSLSSDKSAGDTLRSNSVAPLSPTTLVGEDLEQGQAGFALGTSWSTPSNRH